MRNAAIRAVRTFVQTVIGFALASGAIQALSTGVVDWTALKTAAIGAAVAGTGAVLSFAQNLLEEKYGVLYNKG